MTGVAVAEAVGATAFTSACPLNITVASCLNCTAATSASAGIALIESSRVVSGDDGVNTIVVSLSVSDAGRMITMRTALYVRPACASVAEARDADSEKRGAIARDVRELPDGPDRSTQLARVVAA